MMFSQNDLALHRSRLPIARNPRNILETGEPNKMTCIGVMRILCGYTGMLEPDPAVHGYYNCCEKESRCYEINLPCMFFIWNVFETNTPTTNHIDLI